MLRLAAVLLLAACNVQPTAELAAFGDSVTWGYGDLPGGWVKSLEDKTGYQVSNLGVPGERSDGAAGRIDGALRSAPGAQTVFVLHGGNDWVKAFRSSHCNRKCEPAEVDNKYEAIGDDLRAIRRVVADRGRQIVFLTYWPSSKGKCPKYDDATFVTYQKHRVRLNDEIIEVADEHGDHVVRTGDMVGFGDDDGDFYDCLHPSGQGYGKIASRILDDASSWEPGEPGPMDILKPRL